MYFGEKSQGEELKAPFKFWLLVQSLERQN